MNLLKKPSSITMFVLGVEELVFKQRTIIMKKSFIISMVLLVGVSLTEAKNAFVPYYIRNTDSSKVDAVKTDRACGSCDCGDDSSNGVIENPLAQQKYIDLTVSKIESARTLCGCGCDDGDDIDMPAK